MHAARLTPERSQVRPLAALTAWYNDFGGFMGTVRTSV